MNFMYTDIDSTLIRVRVQICLMNIISICKLINNKVEKLRIHFLICRRLMNSKVLTPKTPSAKLGSLKPAISNLQFPLNYLKVTRIAGELTNQFSRVNLASVIFCFLINHYIFLGKQSDKKKKHSYENNFPKEVIYHFA